MKYLINQTLFAEDVAQACTYALKSGYTEGTTKWGAAVAWKLTQILRRTDEPGNNMNKIKLKVILSKRLEDAEYWAGKNGYEQEAMNEVLSILALLIKVVTED